MHTPRDAAVARLGICLMDIIPCEQNDVCYQVIHCNIIYNIYNSNTRETNEMPLTGGLWLNKLWHSSTMGYRPAVKKDRGTSLRADTEGIPRRIVKWKQVKT